MLPHDVCCCSGIEYIVGTRYMRQVLLKCLKMEAPLYVHVVIDASNVLENIVASKA